MYENMFLGDVKLKYVDKFLKWLKTDRNTFFTYILTLLTAYIMVDRIIEWLILSFTGMSVSYWGPITYTLAIACPVFAYLFSVPSKFCKTDQNKKTFFCTYCICLYVVAISAVVQWLNRAAWIGILSLPNYSFIVTEFSDLIIHALTAVSLYIPIVTFYKLLNFLNRTVNDPIFPNNYVESVEDFAGLDISAPDGTTGPYSLEIELCKDRTTGKPVKLIESRRFYPMLVIGPSGTGKTSMVMEPMIARDLEKKHFYREVSKEMGYTALKTGIATLNKPYDNDYLNKNFTLNMLIPTEGKERIYKAYMSKMISEVKSDGSIIYKNFGITVVTPDEDHTDRIKEVAKCYDIPVIEIDPSNPNSVGLNPFIIPDPALCGLITSLCIKGLYNPASYTAEMAYAEDISLQATQNVVILLKLMYSKMHDGLMPSLEDLLKCFTNFDLVEEMCEELKKNPELAKQYELQIGYFEQYFYKNAPGRTDMQKYVHFESSTLDVLLRSAAAKSIICNRYNNIDFNDVINNGKVVLLSTRPHQIGSTGHKGFGNFFLMLMMCSVENNRKAVRDRIPHFMYIDEFNEYTPDSLSDMYTLYRKFKIGTIYSSQTIGQLGKNREVLLANSPTKISFGNTTPEETNWWMQEFGKRKEWKVGYSYDKNDGQYSDKLSGPEWGWVDHMKLGKIQGLKFKTVIYKIKNKKGKNVVNFGVVDFLESKYKTPHKLKKYNFAKYVSAVEDEEEKEKKPKWNPKKVKFKADENGDVDPIQTDTTDSSYFFDNEDAVSFNLGSTDNNNE